MDLLAVLGKMRSNSYCWDGYQVGDAYAADQAAVADEAIAAVAELIEERDRLRKELAWNAPVVWALRTNDPDPQYDFSVGEECPSEWMGNAVPLYDGQGMRPINWQKTVAELIRVSERCRIALPVLGNLIRGTLGNESGGAAKADMLVRELSAALANVGSAP